MLRTRRLPAQFLRRTVLLVSAQGRRGDPHSPSSRRPLIVAQRPPAATSPRFAPQLQRPRPPQHALVSVRSHGGHNHSHMWDSQPDSDGGKDPEGHDKALFVTLLGLAKNFSMTIGKAIVGYSSNSSALIADAAHSASDMVSDMVAVATLKVARLPADSNHPYGHGKYESIGALSVSTLLVGAGGGLVWHSFELVTGSEGVPVPGSMALWVSVICVVVNEAMFHITLKAGEKARSPTVIANAWHHRADAGASAVALLGIGGSMVGFPWMDPVAGGLVGVMIAHTGAEMVWQSVSDLTDTVDAEEIKRLQAIIKGVGGVESLHNVRLRKMGPYSIVDAQITVGRNLSVSAASQVAERARVAVMEEMKEVTEMLVHVQPDTRMWEGMSDSNQGDAGEAPGIHDLRGHGEVEADVRKALENVVAVKRVSHVHVDYLWGKVQVRCGIELDDMLRVWQAVEIAREARTEIEVQVADVSQVDVSINLNDMCWGQCGLTFGPACATGFKLKRGDRGERETLN